MNRKKLVIWGASSMAAVVAEIVRAAGEFEIVGFLDDVSPERAGEQFCGASVLGGEERLDTLHAEGVRHATTAFGNTPARLRAAQAIREHGFELASQVDPRAVVSERSALGPGTIVQAGAVVQPGVRTGQAVLVGATVTLGHDTVLGDGVMISNGANLAGAVTVGEGSWIATGAVICDRLTIGRNVLVGAGAVVTSDLPDGMVAYGAPARAIRKVSPDDFA